MPSIESQGIQVRRISTVAGSTAACTTNTISFSTATRTIIRSTIGGGDWITDGFATGMRIEITGSATNNGVFTISAVTSASLGIWEPILTEASGATVVITGHSFSKIGQITGFSGPTGSAAVIDITSLDSTAKEKRMAIKDEGNVTLDIILDTSATSLHTALKEDRAARTLRIFDIKLTDTSTNATSQPTALYFDAYVTGLGITGAVDDIVKGSITLEITSSVRWINKIA